MGMMKRNGIVKRIAALLLALICIAALASCKPHSSVPVEVDIDDPATNPPTVTAAPTAEPTDVPTEAPTEEPTEVPTEEPTAEPTATPEPANPSTKRKVYLTIDDGPWDNTNELLDILADYGIKATFFTIGRSIVGHTRETKRIVEEGHLLACHTMSHDFNIIYKSPEAFAEDVDEWRELVTMVVGYDAGAYVFRFPGGSTNSTIGGRSGRGAYLDVMHEKGYIAMDWNIGTNDKWLAGNTEHLPLSEYFWKSFQETYSWYKDKDPLILIIHDTEIESIRLLPRILDDLIAKGFEFGTCDEIGEDYLM